MFGYICRKLVNTWGWASHPHNVFIPSTITFPWPNLSEISFIPTKVAIHHGNWRDPQIFCWPVGGIDVTCHPEYNNTQIQENWEHETMPKTCKKYQDISDLESSADFSGLWKRAPGINCENFMINRFLRLGDSRPQTPPDAAACDSGAKIREWMLQMHNT